MQEKVSKESSEPVLLRSFHEFRGIDKICKNGRGRSMEIFFRRAYFLPPKLQGDSLGSWKYRKHKAAVAYFKKSPLFL